MFGNLNGWHLVALVVVVLVLFGAPKLPGLARSIGQSMRIFRSEVKTMKDENGDPVANDEAVGEPVAEAPAAKPAAKPAASKPATKPKD